MRHEVPSVLEQREADEVTESPSQAFRGSYVALVTPMRAGGDIDWKSWQRLLEWHASSGTAGVVVGGTTGESACLDDDELRELTIEALRIGAGRMQVIVGVGSSCTRTTIERAQRFARHGVDGLLVVTPAYNKPPQRGLIGHFRAAARAVDCPVILYNVPSRTAVDLLPETVQQLAAERNIVALKEAVPSLERIQELRRLLPATFAILSGDDATACRSLSAGACGAISVTANVAPGQYARMVSAALAGNVALAQDLDAQLADLHRDLFIEANPIPVKWLLQQMGMIDCGIRAPLAWLDEASSAPLRRILQQLQLAA
ncbi:MAG: 4-hydroxy-tetrahydrodipicolinate synthase [Steroidobacteraceae bacterium]